MADVLKTSPFQLPDGKTVETVTLRLPGGRIVVRTRDEIVERPTPPRPAK